jgi:putative tricarboxylic transport membrane protein
MVEQNFITSLIKSDGSIWPFFSRPVAAILAFFTIAALLWPVAYWLWGMTRRTKVASQRG